MKAQADRDYSRPRSLHPDGDRARLLSSLPSGLDGLTDPILIVDPDGELLDVNRATLDVLGFASFHQAATSMADYRHTLQPHYRSGRTVPTKAWPTRRIARGESFRDFRAWVTTGDGRCVLLSMTGSPARDSAGNIAGGIIIAHDVTEENRRETRHAAIARVALALGGHLELPIVIQTVIEHAKEALDADAVMLWTPDREQKQLHLLAYRGVIGEMEARIQTITLDTPAPAAEAATNRHIVVLGNLARAPKKFELSRELGKRHGFRSLVSVPLIANDELVGVMSYASRRVRHYTDEDLRTVAAIGHIFAVALSNALAFDRERELRAELEAVIESSPEAILFLKAPEGQVLLANTAAETIYGRDISYQAKAIDHAQLYNLHWPSDQPLKPEESPSLQALQGKTILGLEIIVQHTNGQKAQVLVNSAPVNDKEGHMIGAVVLFQDISRIKELETQREELLAIVAHDLRAPLTIIMGYADLLQRLASNPNVPDEARQGLEAITENANRLDRMIEDILDIARLETRQLSLQPGETNLSELVQSLVNRLGEIARGHPIRVEIAQPTLIWADRGRTEQVLTNLLSNAAKYSAPGTDILVKVVQHNGEAVVSVSDHGPGIAPGDVSRIFERGYRARPLDTEGLGLGLHISRQLVEAQGGRIWVESQQGVGSTFYFSLPLAHA